MLYRRAGEGDSTKMAGERETGRLTGMEETRPAEILLSVTLVPQLPVHTRITESRAWPVALILFNADEYKGTEFMEDEIHSPVQRP